MSQLARLTRKAVWRVDPVRPCRLALLALIPLSLPLSAHVVSMSSSELHVTGRTAAFELRMPAYEVEHVSNPETELLDQIEFAGAERTSSECSLQVEEDTYLCHATYQFAADVPDQLQVQCTLYEVTVPNHVHMLYAVNGENSDQVVLDQSFPRTEIRFRPPSLAQRVAGEAWAGVLRLFGSAAGLLFLAALALAARARKEGAILVAAFLAAEWVAQPLAAALPLGLSPGFLEATMALTVAYLAAEVLLLPDSKVRWAIVPILGLVHGFSFAAFPAAYLSGATLVQLLLLAGLMYAALKLPARVHQVAAIVILVAGIGWFTRMLIA